MGRNILTIARIHPSNFRLSKYHAIMPPVAAEIFSEIQWSDFITRPLHLVYYDLANYIVYHSVD